MLIYKPRSPYMLIWKSGSQLANLGEEACGGTDKCPSQSDSRQLCVFFPPSLMLLCILSPPTNTSLGITLINSIMVSSYVNCGTTHSCLLTSQRQVQITATKAALFCFDQLLLLLFTPKWRYFPGGSAVKNLNLPCNAGDVGLIPGPRAKTPHASCMLGCNYWAWRPEPVGHE